MTSADRQLIDWYFAQPGRYTSWDIAVGYLLNGGCTNPRLKRECEQALDAMRAERVRDLARRVA